MVDNEQRSHMSILSYDKRGTRIHDSVNDIGNEQNVWVDLVNPSSKEVATLQKHFAVNEKALEQYNNQSKKAQIRVFDEQIFTVVLALGFENAQTLTTESIYMFAGPGWLITIRPDNVDAVEEIRRLFEQKEAHVISSSVNNIYYSIIANVVNSYEQLLTSIELTIASLGEVVSSRNPSQKTLDYLDVLSRQIIILRRQFWRTRHIINVLINTKEEKDNPEVKALKVAYDEINQLIELIESLRDSINSTRDLYTANVSLQLNDTMRTLTIFSSILLPLTFVAGIFGMNGFDLNNVWAFPSGFALVAVSMAIVTGILFMFFRRKQWLLAPKKKPAKKASREASAAKGKNGDGGNGES